MAEREDARFRSGADDIAAWLYRPTAGGDVPLLVMAHGLGGVKTMRLDAFAERFTDAGYACLVFDYRNFGESGGAQRQVIDVGWQLADWAAAVAYAHTLPGVDHSRIVVWGTSFGGGHAISTGAKVPGVAAVIAQCPFTDNVASLRTLSPAVSARVTVRALRDEVANRRGRPPVMVAVAGRSGEVALMNAPDVYDGYLRLVPPGAAMQNEVPARAALQILTYRPGPLAATLSVPALFCVCEHDTVAPAKATRRHVAKAPRGEVKLYPDGHFDIYVGEPFERVVADQIAFLRTHVPVGGPA
jgi:dienelactone hydrolase